MLISLTLILLIVLGGMMLTYLVAEDERFMWRLAAGNIVGSAIFGLIAFAAACLFGFGPATILVSLGLTLLPLLLLQKKGLRNNFLSDWAKAKGKLQGGGGKRIKSVAYYAFFILLFWFFFDQAMYTRPDGIYTGGSNNLGDLPFHLGAIFGFTDGNNFPPQNPSWAGARFSYPFIADFLTACFVKLGVSVETAMFWQNFSWALSLLVILERFVAKVTSSELAGRIAPALLFFSGGLGFVWFFKDYWESGQSIVNFIWHLPKDYTIGDHFRWGNSMVVLFITQRSLLLGMPLAVLVLGWLWKVFATEDTESAEERSALPLFPFSPFLLGLLAGMLPLIHLHSLAALFVVTGFLFVMQPAKWKTWIMFGVGVAVIAIPELLWSMSGSASETGKFFEWHFGWDKRDDNFLWFWIKNTGIVIPVVIAGIWVYLTQSRKDAKDAKAEDQRPKTQYLVLFYLPFAVLFVISNAAKLAPWEWDNIKVLIYWFVGSIPLIALAIAWAWEQTGLAKVTAAACFVVLTLGGALDVWRTASGQIKTRVFEREAMQVAAGIKQKTEPNALFLNAPTYNSAVVLSGRRSLMRYSGHLSSHGIDYLPREDDVKRIYEGGGVAEILMRKYNIEYVLISPEEINSMKANEDFFRKYPVIAEAGQYRVYKIK
ncbi:MAG TPA: hypothetical protein PLL77_00580 [Pyrinomonadaceae bacterium]|nr:hypothetical protein [Pyrinomonadaceae bacterium]